MKKRSRAPGWVLLAVAIAIPAAAADDVATFTECTGLELSLEVADYYYWIASEKGRVVLVRGCGMVGADCDHDVVTVWDRDGRKVFEAAPFLDIPEMSDGSIRDAALREPDRLVVSAIVGRSPDFRPVLAEYDVESGELLWTVPTGPVQCLDLAGDGEGLLWCLGVDTPSRIAGDDYDLVYRFDEVGELEDSTLPRSTFPPQAQPLADTWRGYHGGFLVGEGPMRLWLPDVGELFGFDDAGRIVDRLALPMVENQQREHLASSPDDEVYAMLVAGDLDEPSEWTQALYQLADDGSAWLSIEGIPDRIPMKMALVGTDDEGLVLLDRKTLTLCRLPVAGEAAVED